MSETSHSGLRIRLEALHADLRDAPGESPCSPSAARVFNALLRLAKETNPDDPVFQALAPLKLEDQEHPSFATVCILAGQLVAGLSGDAAGDGAGTRRRSRST